MKKTNEMNFEVFCQYVKENILMLLGSEYADAAVEVHNVRKHNNQILAGLTVRKESTSLAPCIYLDIFYEKMDKEGLSPETVIWQIADIIRNSEGENLESLGVDLASLVEDFDWVRGRLFAVACDPTRNAEMLNEVPHAVLTPHLGVYCRVRFECEDGNTGSVIVQNNLIQAWKKSFNEVLSQAYENVLESARLHNICSMMESMMSGNPAEDILHAAEPAEISAAEIPMFCLDNQDQVYGAASILVPEIQEKIGQIVKGDYYIIPSSIHECLVIPESPEITLQELTSMVQEVNDTQVEVPDILSYTVYHYNVFNHKLEDGSDYAANSEKDPLAYGKAVKMVVNA